MRKPRGKLVALLAGTVVAVLVVLTAMFWKDIYCRLFLDPRLVGRWKSDNMVIQFDRIGNVRVTGLDTPRTGTYSIDGDTLIVAFPEEENPNELTSEAGDALSIERGGLQAILRRVPDDS